MGRARVPTKSFLNIVSTALVKRPPELDIGVYHELCDQIGRGVEQRYSHYVHVYNTVADSVCD